MTRHKMQEIPWGKETLGALDTPINELEKKALQNELWKTSYFKKNPVADSNKDGKLSWPEFNAHKKQNN